MMCEVAHTGSSTDILATRLRCDCAATAARLRHDSGTTTALCGKLRRVLCTYGGLQPADPLAVRLHRGGFWGASGGVFLRMELLCSSSSPENFQSERLWLVCWASLVLKGTVQGRSDACFFRAELLCSSSSHINFRVAQMLVLSE